MCFTLSYVTQDVADLQLANDKGSNDIRIDDSERLPLVFMADEKGEIIRDMIRRLQVHFGFHHYLCQE